MSILNHMTEPSASKTIRDLLSKVVVIDGVHTETDPVLSAIEDCDTVVYEGTNPADLINPTYYSADEALINAMGTTWVLRVASADPSVEYTDEAWELIGLPWCKAYSAAYQQHAADLAAARATEA